MSNKYFDSANNPNRALPYEVARAEQINNTDDLIEAGLDLVEADVNRAIKLPTDVTTDQVLTSTAAQRQNSLLAFDASGNATLTGTDVAARSGKVMGWDNSGNINLYSYANDITAPVNAAAASASAAANSATSAATSATNSANSATASATSATDSAASATASANSATASATSAATATTQAANAATSATTATTKASEAAASALSASGSASTATTQATNASNSATSAATSATNAASSATTASNAATTATTQANTATTQATNAETSATLASDWAQKTTGEVVTGQGYSAKYWAQEAASIVTAGVIDDASTSTIKTWSSSKVSTELGAKQDTLVSGTNIKTINGESVLGGGNISFMSPVVAAIVFGG